MEEVVRNFTKCWDCRRATSSRSWPDRLKPVKGWQAIPTEKRSVKSFFVVECPLFERDATGGGGLKWKKDQQ